MTGARLIPSQHNSERSAAPPAAAMSRTGPLAEPPARNTTIDASVPDSFPRASSRGLPRAPSRDSLPSQNAPTDPSVANARAWGVMLAGLLFGLVESLITAFLGSSYTQILTFTLVIVALAIVPNGLFGRAELKKV